MAKPRPRPKPLLLAATLAALLSAAILVSATADGAVVLGVALPVALCLVPLLWSGRPAGVVVLIGSWLVLVGYIFVSAASVGLWFLPSAILMLLAVRRSMDPAESAPRGRVTLRYWFSNAASVDLQSRSWIDGRGAQRWQEGRENYRAEDHRHRGCIAPGISGTDPEQ